MSNSDNSDVSSVAAPLGKKVHGGGIGSLQVNAAEILTIEVYAMSGAADAARQHVASLGTVKSRYAGAIHAEVRADRIESVASHDAIRRVEEYSPPRPVSTSEGVQTTNADELHDLGLNGDDVTVGVIDRHFNPEQPEIKDKIVAQIGGRDGFRPGQDQLHGTACAEIISEMAPNADLVLASTQGENIFNLMDEITTQTDPDIISMSLGFKPTLQLDGRDVISQRISEYTNDGNLFCVSAGNEADGSHWDGQFRDTSGNDYMEFDDEETEFFEIKTTDEGQEVVIQSDNNWSTNQQYSVEVYDEDKNLIANISRTTTTTQAVQLPGESNTETTSYIKIRNVGLNGGEHFDLFAWGTDIRFPVSTARRSIAVPATSVDPNTLSVAAVRHDTDELEPFSSRGPTQDGRRGIDISGPDGTRSDSYSDSFFGTSAACPHVAGAAALLADLSTPTGQDIREALTGTARAINDGDVSEPPNRKIGDGYVNADPGLDALVGLTDRWETTSDDRPQFASPDTGSQHVVVGGLGQTVAAYNRGDGTESWTVNRAGSLSDSSPSVHNGTVFVGGGSGNFYARDASDGTELWTHQTDSAITATPTVQNGTVLFATNDGTVHARAVSDGTERWTTDVDGAVYSELATTNGFVFLTTNDGRLVCLDAADGTTYWTFDTGTELGASSPAVGTDRVYVSADNVYAFSASDTRSTQWKQSYDGFAAAAAGPTYHGPTNSVYVGSSNGTLYALDDSSNGAQRWTNSTGAAIEASPAAVGDRVIVPSMDGELHIYLTRDGTKLGTNELPAPSRSTPTVVDNEIYVEAEDGSLASF